jgi:hypothetical protein
LLEGWKLNKSFRVARIMQLTRRELLHGPLGDRLRFLGRVARRLTGGRTPISPYNALDTPIRESLGIAGALEAALNQTKLAAGRGPSAAKPAPAPAGYQRNGLVAALGSDVGPVFCFPLPSVPWGYMFQRPQQLARTLVRLGYKTIYAIDPTRPYVPDNQVGDVLPLADGPILYADNADGEHLAKLSRPVILWQYWPHQTPYLKSLAPGSYRIYDCVDDLKCFAQYPELARDHEDAIRSAGLVLATATDLLTKISQQRPDVLHVPNGAGYDDFAHPRACAFPELDELRARCQVLVGYYGALAEWIDWDLLDRVVKMRPDWHFLLVGELIGHEVTSSRARSQRLAREPNVSVWPRQPYERLGYLLSKFDVAIIPFRICELTHAVSPIKLFEYMAGGKPVVSTPLRECAKYPLIRLADTPAEFIEAIEWARTQGQAAEHRARLQQCGAENSWLARAEAVVNALKERGVFD